MPWARSRSGWWDSPGTTSHCSGSRCPPPGRAALAYLFAAALVAAAVSVNVRRAAAAGAAGLGGLFALVVLLHAPEVATHPLVMGAWNGLAEQLALCGGGLLAWALLAAPGERAATAHGIGRRAVGACLLAFGLAHFFYLDFTAGMVPKWLPPGQTFWAVATGVAHIAAGLAILTQVRARLAAVLLTVMFAGFGILIHAPLLLADPHSHLNWVMNAVNLALTGSAWVMADALAAPWPAVIPAAAVSR